MICSITSAEGIKIPFATWPTNASLYHLLSFSSPLHWTSLSLCPHTKGPVCGMLLAFHTADFFITFPNYPMETSSPLPVPHFQH